MVLFLHGTKGEAGYGRLGEELEMRLSWRMEWQSRIPPRGGLSLYFFFLD
jgi:hypothetical protein